MQFIETVKALKLKNEFFSIHTPVFISRAPGRLDLVGGNDDYTGGLVFESTIREATCAAVQLRDDDKIVFLNPQMAANGWTARVEFALVDLITDEAVKALVGRSTEIRWTAYTLGCIH